MKTRAKASSSAFLDALLPAPKKLRPMLAWNKPLDIPTLPYPLLASPKLDGVRALVLDGVLVSRNLKPIPNQYCQKLFGGNDLLEGCDGELIVGDAYGKDVFDRTQSGVMSRDGEPDVTFHIFDNYKAPGGYGERGSHLLRMHKAGAWPEDAVLVPHHKVFHSKDLHRYERECLAKGFEGVMLRRLAKDTPYKFGRSTLKEALLMKLIRKHTRECVVVDYVEQLHNENEKTVDARGYAKRSKVKANMKPTGKLGALVLARIEDPEVTVFPTFEVGTGFTDEQRIALWQDRKNLKGKVVTVEYREETKDGSFRFTAFKHFRNPNDMD